MWNRELPHDRRERLFDGRGVVRVWNLCGAPPAPPFGAILACELEGGGSVGPHVQQEFAEVLIVIEGEGVARVGDAPLPLRAGAAVEIPFGRTLAIENGSTEHLLRYLIIKVSPRA